MSNPSHEVWYKDRDFPEIKRGVYNSSADILAVVPDEKQLLNLVNEHNAVVLSWAEASYSISKAIVAFERIAKDQWILKKTDLVMIQEIAREALARLKGDS